jgi:hypothetical protein
LKLPLFFLVHSHPLIIIMGIISIFIKGGKTCFDELVPGSPFSRL